MIGETTEDLIAMLRFPGQHERSIMARAADKIQELDERIIELEAQPPQTYFYLTPRLRTRANVREPIDPRITVPLVRGHYQAELNLTVQQSLELARLLIAATQMFCIRADIRDALGRSDPGPCNQALGLS